MSQQHKLPPDGQLPADTPFIPDHQLIRPIDRGSYGQVWLAMIASGAYRAVKIVHRAQFDDDRPYEREFAGLKSFEPISRNHEGFVDILHLGRDDQAGFFYYVMEAADDFASGPQIDPARYAPRTLEQEIRRRQRLPVAECLRIGCLLAEALEYLHRSGRIHRDIKPSNIIFVGDTPKLADIGLVTQADSARSFVGTEGFVPPEGPGSVAADIYSLGKVIYEMSMGKDRQAFPSPPTALIQLPERDELLEINEIITKACAPDVSARYRSARELLVDLKALQAGKSVRRLRRRQRYLRWSAIAGLAAAVAAGVFHVRQAGTESGAVPPPSPLANRLSPDWPMQDKDLRGSRWGRGATRMVNIADYKVRWRSEGESRPLIGDVMGDGGLEIVSAENGLIKILDRAGRELRSLVVNGGVGCGLGCLADMDGDGKQDIWVGLKEVQNGITNLGMRVYTAEGKLLHRMTTSQTNTFQSGLTPQLVQDIDGDGRMEVVSRVDSAYAKNRRGLRMLDYRTGRSRWETDIGPTPRYIRLGDVEGDGRLELVHGNSSPGNGLVGRDGSVDSMSYAYRYDAVTGLPAWRRSFSPTNSEASFFDCHVYLPDLDGDGRPEIVAAATQHAFDESDTGVGEIHLLNPANGESLSRYDLKHRLDNAAFADLDGDGKEEMVVSSREDNCSSVRWFKGRTLRPGNAYYQGGVILDCQGVCDLTGDGVNEVLVVSRSMRQLGNDKLLILSSNLKRVLGEIDLDDMDTTETLVADLDQNGSVEIIVASNTRLTLLAAD